MNRLVALLGLCAALGCDARNQPAQLPPADRDADPHGAAAALAAADASVADADGAQAPWAELIRQARWREASEALAKLPAESLDPPAVRLARARVAYELNQPAEALELLQELETKLPLVMLPIARLRAFAAMKAGRHQQAGEELLRLGPNYLLSAAEAFALAGDGEAVKRALAGKLPRSDQKSVMAEIRRLRLPFVEAPKAQEDARWLATVGAATPAGELGLRWLQDHKLKLDDQEIDVRAHALADAGQVKAAREIAAEIERGGSATHQNLACFVRASALYNSRAHYKEASAAYVGCEKGAARADLKAEAAFFAARALLRGDFDDEAITLFERLLERYPSSVHASESRALIARTHLLHGRFELAHTLYERWASQMKNGNGAEEFARYRPLAALLAKKHEKAQALFEERMFLKDASEARYATLFSAVSAQARGELTLAKGRLRGLFDKSPWSLPGQFAKLRLEQLGEIVDMRYEAAPPARAPLGLALPEGVQLLHDLGLDDDAEALLEAHETVLANSAKGRESEAVCDAYLQLDRGRRPYRMSSSNPQHYLDRLPLGAARWVWRCSFPTPFSGAVQMHAKAYGVPESLIYAVMRIESGFDQTARSRVGAVGLMQLMPSTAEALQKGVTAEALSKTSASFEAPSKNIELGARHLQDNHALEGSWPLAVMGYNGSPTRVRNWRKRLPELPLDLFIAVSPLTETRKYVTRVLESWARYQALTSSTLEAEGRPWAPSLDLTLPPASP